MEQAKDRSSGAAASGSFHFHQKSTLSCARRMAHAKSTASHHHGTLREPAGLSSLALQQAF